MDDLSNAEDMLDIFQANRWAPTPAAFFNARGLMHGTVERFGLGYTGEWGNTNNGDYRGCLVIPDEDGMGNLRKLRYRPLEKFTRDEKRPKYLTTPGSKAHLFAVRSLDNEDVYVCEGEIDAMILWQIGLKAVALPGAQTFRPEWRHLFREPHVTRVHLVLDPDKAGMKAAKRLFDLLSDVTDVTVVQLPPGLDVNDAYLTMGVEALKEVLNG